MEQITLKNSVLVVKKQHDFVAGNVPNRMRSSKKKKVKDTWNIVYLNSGTPSWRHVTHAVTHLSSDGLFAQIQVHLNKLECREKVHFFL